MKRPKLKTRRREFGGAESPLKDRYNAWNPDWHKLLIVAGLAAIPYIPSLDGDFVFDDSATILNNPIVTGKSQLKQVFVTDYWGYPIASPHSHKSYRPITTLTFW
ncbi:hypothetical protein NECAME_12053 [Necator americanus]|nr:hypothetical protein NECAME_12053 [Necator americanus]ETN75927.1 hypothetical protein NECAME_12053 [Necator americanus]